MGIPAISKLHREAAFNVITDICPTGTKIKTTLFIGKAMKTIDDLIVRRFTKELKATRIGRYDLFQWKRVDVIIKDYRTNEIIHDMRNLNFQLIIHRTLVTSSPATILERRG